MTVQSPQPPKKGLGPLAWVGIGCGVLIVMGVIAAAMGGYFLKKKLENPVMAAAELAIRANPDVELVESDSDAGTLTVRDKKSGKVFTINADDAKEGRISIESDEGTATFDSSGVRVTDEKGQESTFRAGAGAPKDLPKWIPNYPGGTTQGSYTANSPESRTAAFTVTTQDGVDEVLNFYQDKLEAEGLSVQKTTAESGGGVTGGTLTGTSEDQKRTVNVIVSSSNGETTAMVTFEEKK
jgi:hypothetical protein